MKKLILLTLGILISFSSSFATYSITPTDKTEVEKILVLIQKRVDLNYNTILAKKIIYHKIVDSIDLYIVLHSNKLSDHDKAILLLIKTYILKYLWYKIWNPISINIVN